MGAQDERTLAVGSLYEEAGLEAERHKWIESQKHGRDLGERAIRDWYRNHWSSYCRHRRLEHLGGERRWLEFSDERFGCLYALIVTGDLLVDRILDRVCAGYENLELINWSLEWGLPPDQIIDILSQLDVNRSRLDPCPSK